MKRMRKPFWLTMALTVWILIAAAPGTAPAALKNLLNDTLSWNTELTAGNEWAVSGTSLTWVITNPQPGVWHYEYIWVVGTEGKGNLSHFMLEVTTPGPGGAIFQFKKCCAFERRSKDLPGFRRTQF